ncbi:MAG TPA: hypothetical protein VGK73_05795 [Polyangiaceae bacterium]
MVPLAVRHVSLRSGLVLLAATAVGLAGCAEQSSIPTLVLHPTLVEVSPTEFMQGVPCLDATGAMRSYVATVTDLGPTQVPNADGTMREPFEPFALPSSGAVDCDQPVGFARLVDGHHYTARIDGYDRPGLSPLAVGVPVLIDTATGERVAPRWTTTCGGTEGTIARVERTRTIGDCEPLVDSTPSELTAVEVRIDAVLGALVCGEEAGQVSHFEVERGPEQRVDAACGSSVIFDDVSAGTTVRLPVYAYESGAEQPSWGTTCTAVAAAGTVVPASCTTLTDRGGVDVAPADVLAAYGLDCSSFRELTLTPVEPHMGAPRSVTSANCASAVRFTGIARGPATIEADVVDLSGATLAPPATCDADVVPNQANPATCALEP